MSSGKSVPASIPEEQTTPFLTHAAGKKNASAYAHTMRTRGFTHTTKPGIQVWQQAVYKSLADCWRLQDIVRYKKKNGGFTRHIENIKDAQNLSKREALEHLHEYDRSQPGMGFEPAVLPPEPGVTGYRELAHYDGYGFDIAGKTVAEEENHFTGEGTFDEQEILDFNEAAQAKPSAPVIYPGSELGQLFAEMAAGQERSPKPIQEEWENWDKRREILRSMIPLIARFQVMDEVIADLHRINLPRNLNCKRTAFRDNTSLFKVSRAPFGAYFFSSTTPSGLEKSYYCNGHGAGKIDGPAKQCRKFLNKLTALDEQTRRNIEDRIAGFEIFSSVLHLRALCKQIKIDKSTREKAIKQELKILKKKIEQSGGTEEDFEQAKAIAIFSGDKVPNTPLSLLNAVRELEQLKDYYEEGMEEKPKIDAQKNAGGSLAI